MRQRKREGLEKTSRSSAAGTVEFLLGAFGPMPGGCLRGNDGEEETLHGGRPISG